MENIIILKYWLKNIKSVYCMSVHMNIAQNYVLYVYYLVFEEKPSKHLF